MSITLTATTAVTKEMETLIKVTNVMINMIKKNKNNNDNNRKQQQQQ